MKKNTWSIMLFLLLPLVIFVAAFFNARAIESRYFDYAIAVDDLAGWIRTLSGSDLEGRQTGTEGGKKASSYILGEIERSGLEAIDGDGGYRQAFDTITPVIDWKEFSIGGESRERISFNMYEDFNVLTDGHGGGIDYEGEILFVDQAIYEIPGDMLEGKVVAVRMNYLNQEAIDYILNHGGLGIIYYQDNAYEEFHGESRIISISDKRARTLFIAWINRETYSELQSAAMENEIEEYSKKRVPGNAFSGSVVGTIPDSVIRGDMAFPLEQGTNLAGWLPAPSSDEYVILAANYDGYGKYPGDAHVPGTVDNASGVASLLAISENLAVQEMAPNKNIVFLFLDGSKLGAVGLEHYMENPIFPLEKSEFIFFDKLGWRDSEHTTIGYNIVKEERYSPMLAENLMQYFGDAGVRTSIERFDMDRGLGLLEEKGIPAVRITSVNPGGFASVKGTPMDSEAQWDAEVCLEPLGGFMNFIAITQYGMNYPGYVGEKVVWAFLAILAIIYFIYAVSLVKRENPAARLAGATVDDWYYSAGYMLATRILYVLTPVVTAFLFIVFIVNIPPFFNMADSPTGLRTNFSAYGVFKQAYYFIGDFGPGVLSHKWDGVAVKDIIPSILLRSAFLMWTSLVLAFVGGGVKGVVDGMRRKERGAGGRILSLALFSIPEVLIILAGLYLLVPLSKLSFVSEFIGVKNLRLFVMPVVSLSVIPAIYFSRLIRIAVEGEKEKVYVRYAKSKGFGPFHIVARHMLKGILIKAAAGLPALATMIVSSQIVVEYLFGFPGLVNYLFNNRGNPEVVLTICILMGALYAVSVIFSKIIGVVACPKGVD